MFHRVRSPVNQIIYLAVDRYDYYDTTEDYIDYSYAEEIICNDYYLTKYDINNNLIPKKFGRDRILIYPYKEEALYDLYVRNVIEIINDRINFTASLFGYLKYKKYKFEYLDVAQDKDCSKELKEISKMKRKRIR